MGSYTMATVPLVLKATNTFKRPPISRTATPSFDERIYSVWLLNFFGHRDALLFVRSWEVTG